MRGPGLRSCLGVCVAVMFLAAGCASGPAASPASTFFQTITPPSGTPAMATTAATAAPPEAPAETPVPTMNPALIGTWTGELESGTHTTEVWGATYTIAGPCAAAGERCGTWEWWGTYDRAVEWAPEAVPGEDWICRGQLRYEGSQDGESRFLATPDSMDDPACDDLDQEGLTLEGEGSVYVRLIGAGGGMFGSTARWGSGTLQRAGGSPAPSP